MDDFLDEKIDAQERGLVVFGSINAQRVLNEYNKEKKDYKWKGFLRPSGMSWSMCVADYVYNKISQRRSEGFITVKGEERKSLGIMRHQEWQDRLLETRLLYGEPNYPQHVKDALEELKDWKGLKTFPEIYVLDPDLWIKSWADGVIKYLGNPWVIDFKTKNEESLKKWKELCSNKDGQGFPGEAELTQCYIYLVLMNKWKYFDKDVAGIRLCYYNNPFAFSKKSDVYPEFEYAEEKDPLKEEKTLILLEEGRNQVERFMAGEPFECRYELCGECRC